MIIDMSKQYWTEQDKRERDEAEEQRKQIITEMLYLLRNSTDPDNDPELNQIREKFEEVCRRIDEIYGRSKARYLKARSKKQLLADAEEIINAVEKEDYQLYTKNLASDFTALLFFGQERNRPDYEIYLERTKENYQNCFNYILTGLVDQIDGLHLLGDDQGKEKIKTLIDKRVSLWYINKKPVYSPMFYEKGPNTITYMSTKNAIIDDISRKLIIEKPGVKLQINETIENQGEKIKIFDFDNLAGALPLSTIKLLSKALIEFTSQNSAHAKQINRKVTIPLKEYAEELGYDVTEKHTATPEEAERERKRVKNQLDNVRKTVKADLDRLHAYIISTEDKKGKSFETVELVSRTAYKNWVIYISFTEEIAEELVKTGLITKFNNALFKIDGKNKPAFKIGKFLSERYTTYNNRVRESNNIISVKTLVEISGIPSYEEVQKTDPGHWEARIKEPLLTALDVNKKVGSIINCKFVHARGVDLTEEEYYNIKTYEQFISLYLWYEMPNPGDEEIIKEKQEQRRQAKARKNQKKDRQRKK
jgi:hypothetical protein